VCYSAVSPLASRLSRITPTGNKHHTRYFLVTLHPYSKLQATHPAITCIQVSDAQMVRRNVYHRHTCKYVQNARVVYRCVHRSSACHLLKSVRAFKSKLSIFMHGAKVFLALPAASLQHGLQRTPEHPKHHLWQGPAQSRSSIVKHALAASIGCKHPAQHTTRSAAPFVTPSHQVHALCTMP
jgi:hypothetical protein